MSTHDPVAALAAEEKARALIRIVDDEPEVRDALALMLRIEGYDARAYPDARSFLIDDDDTRPGCLVLDVRMPVMTGLELQAVMAERGKEIPIIFLTGHADIDVAIASLKRGAVDFLLKPVEDEKLLEAIESAVHRDLQRRRGLEDAGGRVARGLGQLSDRERSVLKLFLEGLTDLHVAKRFGISERTVQGHRARIYRKFGIHTARELEALMPDIRSVIDREE